MYNMTQLANVSTVFGLVQYANDATTELLMPLFVMSVFFIMLMVLKKWEFDSTLLVSSWVCFLLSALLVYAHLMPMLWALVFLIMAAGTAFYMIVAK